MKPCKSSRVCVFEAEGQLCVRGHYSFTGNWVVGLANVDEDSAELQRDVCIKRSYISSKSHRKGHLGYKPTKRGIEQTRPLQDSFKLTLEVC